MKKSRLLQRVKQTIDRFQLFTPGDRILLAVSGGPDSMALLEVLYRLKEEWRFELFVAHFDHGLRKSSREEALFVRKEAEKRRLPFILATAPVREYARREKLSLEVAGRELRYRFFSLWADRLGLEKIALAHQADDLAEEVLLRFIRGAGRRGLAGIPIKREDRYVRPLLLVSREEIETFLAEEKIPFVLDPSNENPRFLRNRVRHLLLPFLEKHFHKKVRESLKRTALLLAEEEEFLSELALEKFEKCARREGKSLILNVRSLKATPLALRRRLYLEAFKKLDLPLFRITQAHLDQIEALLLGRPRGPVFLPSGYLARREPGRLVLKKAEKIPSPYEEVISAPGVYQLPGGFELKIYLKEEGTPPEEGVLLIDPEKAPFPWKVRSPRPGDRIRPPGLSGRKKFKKIFWEKKISHEKRQLWPVIEKNGKIIALAGILTDENFAPPNPLQKALAVSLVST